MGLAGVGFGAGFGITSFCAGGGGTMITGYGYGAN